MKIQEEKRMIEVTSKIYISDDGKEFTSQSDCKKYELETQRNKLYQRVSHLLVLEDYPPCDGGNNSDNHYYKWYKANNIDDLNLINNTYNTNYICDSYPNYFCIEQYDEGDFCDVYGNTLSNCKAYVKELFGELGFDVVITKRK